MKKKLTIALAASMMLLGTSAFAQISVGFGYLNSTCKFDAVGLNTSIGMNGLYAGFDYNYELGLGFGIAPGLYYEFLSAPAKNIIPLQILSDASDYVGLRLDEQYINIPVNFNYRTEITDGIKGFIYCGPTFSIGAASKFKAKVLGIKADICNNYKHNVFNPFDIQLGGGIGIDVNDAIRFSLGYNFGMFNKLGSGSMNSAVSLNRNELHVGLAYIFQ